ncbi:MAG: dihydrolipoamide acetyltransferase family protein [Pseudohongiella sp.]|uniref:dihydrolipoamide acetyltransferase family protein n=1 Tax=Pseudohongiella sp. TaxID=1979412 RepID=UPI0034A01D76
MRYFKLPDLGEGLQEAEIVEWHIKAGDTVAEDQVILSVETAKAIVDVPSPCAGKILTLFGDAGDQVHVGEPLLEYADAQDDDSGTVVGKVKTGSREVETEDFIIGSPEQNVSVQAGSRNSDRILATPLIKALAKRLDVDLTQVAGSGTHGLITADDVEKAAQVRDDFGTAHTLKGVRRVMAKNMARAHSEVVGVTLYDDVDIHAWKKGEDPTMRLVRAIGVACKEAPQLNAWFDGNNLSLRLIERVDLGIAVDTPDGLFVPVLRDISGRSVKDLRKGLDNLREAVKSRKIPPQEMSGATITLSNFGTIAGRYANPVIVPPTVAILGAGRMRDEVVAVDGKPLVHRMLPLSLTFDHRAASGGEAARFLAIVMRDLAQT